MVEYKRKIRTLLVAMQSMIANTRYANRWKISGYMNVVGPMVREAITPFKGSADKLALLPRFQLHIEQEEARLRRSLETAKYDLDGLETLALVNRRRDLERVCEFMRF